MKSFSILLSPYKLFQLGQNYAEIYLDEVLALVKHGNFTRQDVYNMPVYERKFYLRRLIKQSKNNSSKKLM